MLLHVSTYHQENVFFDKAIFNFLVFETDLVDAHASKFRQIFGAGQFDAHFSSPAAFTASLQGKQQMLKQQQLRMSKMKNMDPQSAAMIDSDLSNYILCTTHVGGEAMRYRPCA
jgi:hypothetical protein